MHTISRPNSNQHRIFSPPTNVGLAPSAWDAGRRTPFGWRHHGASDATRGLLWLARAATVAEQEGAWKRADFYWLEIVIRSLDQMKNPARFGDAIRTLGNQLKVALDMPAEDLARRFIDEVVIDALLAAYNGLATQATRTRARDLFQHAMRMIDASAMDKKQRAQMVRPTLRDTIEALRERREWGQIAECSRKLLAANPEDHEGQTGLAGALLEIGTKDFGADKSTSGWELQSRKIIPLVREIDALIARVHANADTFDAAAQLHLLHAISLGHSGDLSSALLAVEEALAIKPNWDDAEAAKRQIEVAIDDLQVKVRELEETLRRTPNSVLTADGIRLREQARRGAKAARDYAASDAAGKRREQARVANERRFWERLGLVWPGEDSGSAAHARLLHAMNAVLAGDPKSEQEIEEYWIAAAKDPALAALDRAAIGRFLAHHALGHPWTPAAAPDEEQIQGERFVLDCMDPASKSRVLFGEWMWSHQDRGLKLRIGAAAMVCAIAIALAQIDGMRMHTRNEEFAALKAAVARNDDSATMKAASTFLSVKPFGSDLRESEVLAAYQRALVSWSFTQGEWGSDQQAIANQYRAVAASVGERK